MRQRRDIAPANEPPPPLPNINALLHITPAPSQRMAFAALHTAGGSASGYSAAISSLGHSNRSPFFPTVTSPPAIVAAPAAAAIGTITHDDDDDDDTIPAQHFAAMASHRTTHSRTPRGTRSTSAAAERARATGQHDSDDDNTEDEVEYQIDPQDGFWNPSIEEENMLRLLQIQELNIDGNDDGHSTCASPVFGTSIVSPAVPDLGALIQNCTDFQFEELSPEALAAEVIVPQPIYEGESGLKRGVAGSFRTPLEAFRKAGFTPDLISRYTQNSNK